MKGYRSKPCFECHPSSYANFPCVVAQCPPKTIAFVKNKRILQISLACDDASETAELQGRAAGVSAHVFSTPLTRQKGARTAVLSGEKHPKATQR